MKKKNRIVLASTVAALSLSMTSGLHAQNTSGSVRATESGGKSSTYREHSTDTSATAEPISKANKASSLIGMDVRNAQNEKLGEIKDLVVDLHTGKIAYAVLSVGGFLGIGDKYIAVPPGAFSVAIDQQRVVLNADKAKIQNAPGFAKSSWPDVNGPTWNTESAYWLNDSTGQGTAASIRSGTASDQTLSGTATDSTRANTHLDAGPAHSAVSSSGSSTSARTDRPFNDPAAANSRDQFRGRITVINPETRTMTVEGPSGSRQFKFSETPAITLKDNRNPRLTDLKVGYPVAVGFHEENGTYVAHSVIRTDAPEVR